VWYGSCTGDGMPQIQSILCPVDFSAGSERAVEQAAALAQLTGASLELLHVYPIPVLSLPEGQVTATPEYVARVLTIAQDELEKLSDPLIARGIRVKTTLLDGQPIETIVRYAKESGASMLVLGTHGRTGIRHFALGSTAERVVRLADVPVLTVRNAA
jgi:nucleotide-binding universal stress UspA family protein